MSAARMGVAERDRAIVTRYTDQPARLPAELRAQAISTTPTLGSFVSIDDDGDSPGLSFESQLDGLSKRLASLQTDASRSEFLGLIYGSSERTRALVQ